MSKRYRMVFIDLDGTTLTTDKRVTPRTQQLLEHLDCHGIPVVINTGRSIYATRHVMKHVQLQSPVVTLNGTVIYQHQLGKIESYKHLPEELLDELIQLIRKCPEIDNYLCEGLDDYYVLQNDPDLVQSFAEIRPKQPIVVQSQQRFAEPITNILVRTREKKEEIYHWLVENTKGKFNFVYSPWHWLEGVNPKVNKGTAMSELAFAYGIDLSEVIAIGDEWNDLEMLEMAGLGVAMGNGSEEAKERADLIAPTNDQEGVATILEEIFADFLIETKYLSIRK